MQSNANELTYPRDITGSDARTSVGKMTFNSSEDCDGSGCVTALRQTGVIPLASAWPLLLFFDRLGTGEPAPGAEQNVVLAFGTRARNTEQILQRNGEVLPHFRIAICPPKSSESTGLKNLRLFSRSPVPHISWLVSSTNPYRLAPAAAMTEVASPAYRSH
jgi:hypothetical protein